MLANSLFILIAVLVFVSNYVRGQTVLWPLLALALFVFCHTIRLLQLRRRSDFLAQLKSHRRELRGGSTVVVDGLILRYDTLLESYTISVGLLIISIEIPSRFRISEGEGQLERVWFSLATMFCGWWSITGPFSTMQTLSENLRKNPQSVAELVDARYFLKDSLSKANKAPVFTAP